LCGCVLGSPARLQTAHHEELQIVVPGEVKVLRMESLMRAERQGDVEAFANLQTEKARRRDTDHLREMFVDQELTANHGILASECALPKRVAEDCSGGSATRLIVFGGEEPPSEGRYAESCKNISADP